MHNLENTESKSLHSRFQSAYRAKHSTETALLKVQSDIFSALDKGRACVLVLLDLSSAFDVIGHGILLRHLRNLEKCSGMDTVISL